MRHGMQGVMQIDDNIPDLVKVLTESQAQRALGLSDSTWRRLKRLGHLPPSVQLSEHRVGWRVSALSEWLDARQRVSSFEPIGKAASRVVENIDPSK
jgi:predicted DNA-binding transcriptional regulator AlpA